ncbi:hypothetical protein V8C44DRAFT_322725 [Trichoderma aethiopicum]
MLRRMQPIVRTGSRVMSQTSITTTAGERRRDSTYAEDSSMTMRLASRPFNITTLASLTCVMQAVVGERH